ncbi:MAG: EamA family transporter [Clostridia bacterium]|nr:EamA family transporter [Clostridia bacterium]
MWILFAAGSAFFAGITSILAKCGIKETDSDTATAIRTFVVLIFSWLMVFITGAQEGISSISYTTLIFLILSGLATGASWLCYFKALQLGSINKVVPIDKSSTVIAILLAFIILGEPIGIYKGLGIILIGAGTYMMIERKAVSSSAPESKRYIVYAFLSAIFAALTSILGKIGIKDIDSNLGTAIRTIVVLIMAWLIVFMKNKGKEIYNVSKKELIFIILSGFATGASWLCYYRALRDGQASIVVPIDKLSILVSILFSYLVFKEKLTKKSFAGLIFITLGTLIMLIQ